MKELIKIALLILSVFLAVLLLNGCKARVVYQTVEIPKITTQIDTFRLHTTDSVIFYTKNDTVYRDKYRIITKERVKIQVDTIGKPIKVVEYVDRKVEVIKYKRGIESWIGIGVIVLAIGYLAFKIGIKKGL